MTTLDPRLSFSDGWLCQCGNGRLIGPPPRSCEVCGIYFSQADEDEDLGEIFDTLRNVAPNPNPEVN